MEAQAINQVRIKYQQRPDLFCRDILGVEFESYQKRITKAVAANSRVAIAACHDVGKSFTLARLVLWFATCFPYSKVITTAPTYNQVKNILWSEIRSAYGRSKAPLGGTMLQTEWQLSKHGDWFAIGFTPRNEVSSGEGQGTLSTFQGFHAEGGILVVFDEATGIPMNTWTMAEGILTQAHVKFVAIGNPTSSNSEFARCFKDPAWEKIYLNCFDSPNLQASGIECMEDLERELDMLCGLDDEDVRARLEMYSAPKPYLLSARWVMERALKWGLNHPLFVSKVLGKFPEEGDDTLIPLGAVEEAQRTVYWPVEGDRRVIGVDVARFGMDSSVLTYIHGKKQLRKQALVKRDTMQVAGAVIQMCRDVARPDVIVVDGTGLGSGVVDALRQSATDRAHTLHGVEIREVHFGAAPVCKKHDCPHKDCEKSQYANQKARMFDLLSRDIKSGFQLLDEDVYLDELPTIRYAYNSKGQMVIESKDDYKKRTGRGSPDHADSLALANSGRYNEMRVGSMITQDSLSDLRPMAGSLNSGDAW